MKVSKRSNFTGIDEKTTQGREKMLQYVSSLDADVINLFILSQGRVRFGTPTDGYRGENISGEFQVVTTGLADAEKTVSHTLGSIPIGYLVLKQDKAGSLYAGSTAWTSSNIYLKCSVATVTFTLFLLK